MFDANLLPPPGRGKLAIGKSIQLLFDVAMNCQTDLVDRCKERKMRCDPDPVACQPCRVKNLKCYTTDRVTGQSRERGQSDRAENEVSYLREQLAYYQRRYGSIPGDAPPTPYTAFPSPARERNSSLIYHRPEVEPQSSATTDLPSAQYVGWPLPDEYSSIHKGIVEGTKVDILDWGVIDSGAFECEFMREPLNNDMDFFNFSTSSVLRTINQRQKIQNYDLHLPPKQDALFSAETFLTVMWGYVPVVHRGSFIDLVHRLYDSPHEVSQAEKIQVVQMLGILNHQTAIRNQSKAEKIQDSYRYLHYSLGYFPDLMRDSGLSAMQALAMILIQFRNMPQPGYTWNLAQEMLIRCIDLDYHRDPEKIDLPSNQKNPLAKELRKRVFHSILGICITTGCRLGRPSPWQFIKWDVPLPMPILDSEISMAGIKADLSGRCDFWPCLQHAKLLPLLTELHGYVLSVRRSPADYVKIIEALQIKIDAWRADWDVGMAKEDKNNTHLIISSLLVDTWAAEYILNLHHPSLCTARTADVFEKNLDICHKAAKRMLSNFHKLAKTYKAADFSWHSVVAYTLGFGLTLYIHRRRKGAITQEQFNAMKNELAGWTSLMAYADLVLRTENVLHKSFHVLVEQVQREISELVIPGGHSDLQISRSPYNPVNGTQSRSASLVKQESASLAPLDPRSSQDFTGSPVTHLPHTSHNLLQQQRKHSSPSSYHPAQPGLPSASYSMYNQPAMSYSNLPTSLAPLLNDAPSNSVGQYQNPSISGQDPSMMFSPHLYTDASAKWPLIPEGQFAG